MQRLKMIHSILRQNGQEQAAFQTLLKAARTGP